MSKISKLTRVKTLPWAVLLQAGVLANERWRKLSKRDRARVSQLVRESHGRPHGLNAKQRAELRGLLGKLELKSIGRDLLPLARAARKRGKRRKRR
ncbi:MAG TPA: hypothetical protein VLJ42_01240 [Solirubrobacteraceae bacterium]|nr:hypothetical protein [Solirubrobacteraceae bacterium]